MELESDLEAEAERQYNQDAGDTIVCLHRVSQERGVGKWKVLPNIFFSLLKVYV